MYDSTDSVDQQRYDKIRGDIPIHTHSSICNPTIFLREVGSGGMQ